MKNVLVFITLFLIGLVGFGQESGGAYAVGQNYRIQSKVFGQDREIQVYLPSSYNQSSQRYSVLYILDGNRYFLHGVGFQKSLSHFSYAPQFMVVSVISPESSSQRRLEFSRESARSLRFLEKEVITFVDENFRTSKNRLLFGWQTPGAFVFKAMGEKPGLFRAIISASATAISDEIDIVKAAEKIASSDGPPSFVYMGIASNESWALPDLNEVDALFKKKAATQLEWRYDIFNDEEHATTPYRVLQNGLRHYFKGFRPLRFNSLEEFRKAGGMAHLHAHFKKRGEAYHVSPEVDDQTIFFLLRQALTEDHYDSFDLFMSEFEGYLDHIKLPLWSYRYGAFYLKHQKSEKALSLFKYMEDRFPQSSLIQKGLGDTFRAKANFERAAAYYRSAIEIAGKNQEPALNDYQKALSDLEKGGKEL